MGFTRLSSLLLFLCLSSLAWSQTRQKPQFTPGERDIFVDSLWNEYYGEAPSLWTVSRGGVENMLMDEKPVIGFISNINEIAPRMSEESYLPKTFTIELEVYFHNKGNEGYTIEFNKGRYVFRISRNGISHRPGFPRIDLEELVGWRKIQVTVNGSSLKVYYNGERLVNHPDMGIEPTELSLKVLSHNISTGKYAMIRNIRVAEGGGSLYERFNTTGVLELNNIHFDNNEATIRPDAEPVVARIAEMLNRYADLRVQIEGHTDSNGEADFNMKLSQQRAEAVKEALAKLGVAPERMETIGYGEEKPLDPEQNARAWAINRRVTLRKL